MNELVVVSGKGGTGKTTLVAAFAALSEKTVLADCDVDAADLHLLLEPRIRRREPFKSGHTAFIRQAACTQCGVCDTHCRFDAIRIDRDPAGIPTFSVDSISCEGCGVCVHFCPEGAIDFPESTCGEWFVSETRQGPMVHARLGIAEENSGKLVTLVRNEAKRIVRDRHFELLIVDGPPGIGCPVIASITGASLVLLVTEPTLSGLHDLERVFELADQLGVPTAVCVNQHDINPSMTETIDRECDKRSIPVVGHIRHSEDVVHAMVAKQSVVEYTESPVAEEIRKAWHQVNAMLRAGAETQA